MTTPPQPPHTKADYFASGVMRRHDGFYATVDFGGGKLFIGERCDTYEAAKANMMAMVNKIRADYEAAGGHVRRLGETKPKKGTEN